MIKLGISISDYLNLSEIKKKERREGITLFELKYCGFLRFQNTIRKRAFVFGDEDTLS